MNSKINLPVGYSDERGIIQVLLHEHDGSVVVIDTVLRRESKSVTKMIINIVVVSGSITYYERKVGSSDPIKKYIYKKGEMFYLLHDGTLYVFRRAYNIRYNGWQNQDAKRIRNRSC